MIKSENGVTTIMGTRSMMATDLALIASSMRKALMEHGSTKEEAEEEEILRYVKVGFMSEKEREQETLKKIKNISESDPRAGAIFETLYNIFGKLKETADGKEE